MRPIGDAFPALCLAEGLEKLRSGRLAPGCGGARPLLVCGGVLAGFPSSLHSHIEVNTRLPAKATVTALRDVTPWCGTWRFGVWLSLLIVGSLPSFASAAPVEAQGITWLLSLPKCRGAPWPCPLLPAQKLDVHALCLGAECRARSRSVQVTARAHRRRSLGLFSDSFPHCGADGIPGLLYVAFDSVATRPLAVSQSHGVDMRSLNIAG